MCRPSSSRRRRQGSAAVASAALVLLMAACFHVGRGVAATFTAAAAASAAATALYATAGSVPNQAGSRRSAESRWPQARVVGCRCRARGAKVVERALSRPNTLGLTLVLATSVCYVLEKRAAVKTALSLPVLAGPAEHSAYFQGLCWSCVAIVSKPAISAVRKSLASLKEAVGHAEQVGITSFIQGLAAVAYCVHCNSICTSGDSPPIAFWLAVCMSSALNAIIRISETHAYSVGEMSLAAPFLAFDPVMQLLVGAMFMPFAYRLLGWDCNEGVAFRAKHALAVASIAQGMLSLSLLGSGGRRERNEQYSISVEDGAMEKESSGVRLPKGAIFIILNCILYAFTYRFDGAAISLVSIPFYFACSRLLMTATCVAGSLLMQQKTPTDAINWESQISPFFQARVAVGVLFVCALDGFYMLSMYRAVSLISPVFVSAVKRGGGVLVSALLGSVIFGESLSGRRVPLLTIATGVTFLCL